MNDDWRLRVDLHEDGFAHQMAELLGAEELEHDLERTFHNRIVVSVEGSVLFCYAGSREQADGVEQLVRRLATERGWTVDIKLTHWHAAAEEWEDPDAPAESAAQAQEERVESEREDSQERGYPEFEVRVGCANRVQAAQLARRLRGEGIPHLRRHNFVLVGATDEASAEALAERLRGEAPDPRRVTVERNERAIYEDMPRSPFSVLGGLGG